MIIALLHLLEFRFHNISAIGNMLYRVIIKEHRIDLTQAKEDAYAQRAYLGLSMHAGPLLDNMPPCTCIARDDNWCFSFVGEQRTSSLLYFFAQIGTRLCTQNAEALLLHLQQTISKH